MVGLFRYFNEKNFFKYQATKAHKKVIAAQILMSMTTTDITTRILNEGKEDLKIQQLQDTAKVMGWREKIHRRDKGNGVEGKDPQKGQR